MYKKIQTFALFFQKKQLFITLLKKNITCNICYAFSAEKAIILQQN